MTGCYKGCFYYTDSCFRKDCKKGKAMKPLPTMLASYDKSIAGKTISHFYFGGAETVLVFTDGTAFAERCFSEDDGFIESRFVTQPTNAEAAARLASLMRTADYFTPADAQVYWDAFTREEESAATERDRQEYERLKARFEPKEPT